MYLHLNLITFERLCYQINNLLISKNLFLGVFEKKKKFRYWLKKTPTKNEVKQELSTCVEERFNGFHVVRDLFERDEKRKFYPMDIVYQPVKRLNENIECFFTNEIRLAYRGLVHRGKFRFDSMTAKQCYS